MNNTEIERKFLLDRFPDMDFNRCKVYDVTQAYLSVNPEVRIRSKRKPGEYTLHYLTIKSDGGLVRKEIEFQIDKEKFDALREIIPQPFINKQCRFYQLPSGLILECACVDIGRESQFYYAEIEFPSIEEANAFEPLPCFVKEITDDPNYKMKNYWKRTRLGV